MHRRSFASRLRCQCRRSAGGDTHGDSPESPSCPLLPPGLSLAVVTPLHQSVAMADSGLLASALARAARDDYPAWLTHVKAAAACTRPVRLAGSMTTVEAATGRILSERHTADLPDGVIYKPCGNRREQVCPSCSKLYQRDAYQVVRTGLVGGKGVTEDVARHPAVFPTLTAPSFGEVHTRVVTRHSCGKRKGCDCRPEPCHARRDAAICPHGQRMVCYSRHDDDDPRLGAPLCLDCYDHQAQVVWNLMAGELWRRTTIAVLRYLRSLATKRRIPFHPVPYVRGGKTRVKWVAPFRLSFGKVAEMQRRGVVHFHAIVRLDGHDPDQPDTILPPPAGLDAADLVAAIDHATRNVAFYSPPHPEHRDGWPIRWGRHNLTKVITVAADGEVTDGQVANYLAKYATKSTEVTGHTANRLTNDTIDLFADGHGSHTERLVDACWRLAHARWTCPAARACHHHTGTPVDGRPGPGCLACTVRRRYAANPDANPYPRLRRWAHMLGFGGHFLTKSRRYSITFTFLRDQRVVFRRTQTAGSDLAGTAEQPTTLVVNFLAFVGAGWKTPADAMLANTSAAMAREHQEAAREALQTMAA